MGVLGAANIARKVVIPAILRADGVELVAIGSASGRGAEFVAEAGLAGVRACTYEELLADPDVGAVFIPLPNHLHAEWAMRAPDAGKQLLCEKPPSRPAGQGAQMHDHSR